MATEIINMLQNRASAVRLGEPAPSAGEIDIMISCAVTAPDHGRLRPWRFTVIPSDERDRFGNLLVRALKESNPDASEEQTAREHAKAQRAPIIIVVGAQPTQVDKVPAIEQTLAVAAAAEHLILAANALGYGAMWKTGAPAYSDVVKESCGLEASDSIVGFIFIGTETAGPSRLARAGTESVVHYWRGRRPTAD
jgi:nitroreductase